MEELPAAGEGPLGTAGLLEVLFPTEVFLREDRPCRLVELWHRDGRTNVSMTVGEPARLDLEAIVGIISNPTIGPSLLSFSVTSPSLIQASICSEILVK